MRLLGSSQRPTSGAGLPITELPQLRIEYFVLDPDLGQCSHRFGHRLLGFGIAACASKVVATVAQGKLLIRTSDPIYEIGFVLYGSRAEDRMWQHTLTALAAHFGVDGVPQSKAVCVDRKRQWSNFGQVRHNAAIRGVLSAPARLFRRG